MLILVIHGWLHSTRRYADLKIALEPEHDIILYELPGFGGNPIKYKTNYLDNCSLELTSYINYIKPDIIIAHSMGGNIVLRCLARGCVVPKVILLSPVYNGVPLLKIIKPFRKIMQYLFSKLKHHSTIVKIFSLLTINKWKLIDDMIVQDAILANTSTAISCLYEMVNDTWEIKLGNATGDIIIARGENDRVVPRRNMLKLQRDLGKKCKLVEIENIGHTVIVEDPTTLFNLIER